MQLIPKFQYFSIKWRLVVSMVFLVFIVIAVGTAVAFFSAIEQQKKQLVQETEVANLVLAQDFFRLLLTDRADVASDIITKLRLFPMILRTDFFNSQNEHILRFIRANDDQELATNHSKYNLFVNDQLLISLPLIIQEQKKGVIRYVISTQKIKNRLVDIFYMMFVTALTSIILAILGALYLQRFFTVPLKKLTQKTKEITEADGYTLRINQDKRDNSEFGMLQRSFNLMLARIEKNNDIITEQKENLEVTLNSIGDAVIVTDINGHIVSMNPVAITLTGWTFEQAQGEEIGKVFHITNTQSGEVVENPIAAVLNTGAVDGQANHTSLFARDGKEYQIMNTAAPIKNKQGDLLGVILVFQDVTEHKQTQAIIEAIYQGTSQVSGEKFFQELVRYLAELLHMRFATVVKLHSETEAVTVGFWADGCIVDDIEYSLIGTPCENVVQQGICLYPSEVQTFFPADQYLSEMGIDSYFGIPLLDTEDKTIGLLVVMDDKLITDVPMLQRILEIFAARCSSELSRREAEKIKNIQQKILELIAKDNTLLQEIFESITHFVENLYPGVRATILRMDNYKLRKWSAPSMPAAYSDLIDGLEIGPSVGSCGTAAFLKQRVIVSNIATDPLWANFNHLGLEYGFKSCWSEPILSHKGEVLGTFALYHRESRLPTENEIHLIETMVKMIGMAIQRKQSEQELQKLSRAVEASSTAVIITDTHDTIEYINHRFTDITGYTRSEAIGQTPRFLLQSEETLDAAYEEILQSLVRKGEWKGELHNRKKDGSLYWDRCSISAIKNSIGEVSHYVTVADDMTHEYELSEQLSHQASHDALTGLVNRHEFECRAEQLLASISKDEVEHALCFMDLDQFKVINDTCGHTAGDEMLRQLSQVLQQSIRQSDTLARLGGDEFGVLIEYCSIEPALRVAELIQKSIQDFLFTWQEHSFKIGVSIGLVAMSKTTPDLTELLKAADAACYVAKEKGRNRIHVYVTDDYEVALRHGEMRWVTRLQKALRENQFILYLQTIEPIEMSTTRHYEFLLRLKNERGEIILPGAFLPAAERYNLATEIDQWVVTHVLKLLSNHSDFLRKVDFCTINLSGNSLTSLGFLDFVVAKLVQSGVDGGKICFEITETAVIANLNSATHFIATLKQKGCRFALDDFGSGLSSFGYLKNLQVDYLKIDGMFVRDIVEDPIDRAIVKSINEVGQIMGLETIAEFVENDDIKTMLQKIGINFVQGYGIAKPRPFLDVLIEVEDDEEYARNDLNTPLR